MKQLLIACLLVFAVGCDRELEPGPGPGPGPQPEPGPNSFVVVSEKLCDTAEGERPCVTVTGTMKPGKEGELEVIKARVETAVKLLEAE